MKSIQETSVERRGRRRAIAPEIGELSLETGESTERQLYALLRRAIMEGIFLPGASITGRSIAENLGVSPTPVRDALKRLEADGVIEGRSKSAYFVITLSREQYIEVLYLRQIIEGHAAARAAIKAKPSDVRRIQAIQDRYMGARDLEESVRIDFAFHFEIYKLANCQILMDVIENLWMRIGPSMYLHGDGYDLAAVGKNHQRLIDALKRNDPVNAEASLRIDLLDAMKVIAPKLSSKSAVPVRSRGTFEAPASPPPSDEHQSDSGSAASARKAAG